MSQSENGEMDGWTVENDLIKLNKRFNKKKKDLKMKEKWLFCMKQDKC